MTEHSRPSFSLATIRELITGIRRRFPRPGRVTDPDPPRPETPKPEPADLAAERLRVQVGVIRKAFGESGVAVAGAEGSRSAHDEDVTFLYRPGHLLVRDGDGYERLREFVSEREDYPGELERVAEPAKGLVLVSLPSRVDGGDDVLATLDELDRRDDFGPGFAAPDHILYVTPAGHLCPATEPEEPRCTDPVPPRTDDTTAGEGIRVAVVDTGWWKAAAQHPTTDWVSDVTSDPEDEEVLVGTTIHEYAGHGTFVAGVIKCVAPKSRVEVEGALTHGGAVYESDICAQLQEALHDDDLPQIVSISAGSYTRRNLGLLGFEILAANKGIDDGVKTIVVAAAGNDSSTDEFYPAAYPWVIGVGSVDPDGNRSDFSNYGKWVRAYARGRDLVNAFPRGTYTCHYPENVDSTTGAPEVRQFDGLAQWSGTSFSTPVVAGAIAAHMSATGNLTEPWKAWEELRQAAATGPDGTPLIGPL